MGKYRLHVLIISFVFLLTPIIHSAEEPFITLRSSYKDLSISQVQLMSNISIRERGDWGFCGHSTINNRYEKLSIRGDSVVVNHATGLMWHQSGSDDYITWNNAYEWIRDLNNRGYAGCHDWRLPTVEEAASLLESRNRNGVKPYIDPLFSYKQWEIWTGDKIDSMDGAWCIGFDDGSVHWSTVSSVNFVRPVRSGKMFPPSCLMGSLDCFWMTSM
ncbi:MAG: DUF1566 domain-containing protein [Candidatus Scalindua sp.]|jgi:hypothetical protein|nr:DUF1566 domain-containing protein [Candidatus Scalindua sp.]MBT7592285.1 DUF1566 domain-containing protein [Candidatus Scalindua sp.]